MADVVEEITIKKEIEDSSDVPDQGETPDSSNTQIDSSGNQKQSKVWGEDETRSLIDLHKTYLKKAKDNNYPKRKLLEDVSRDMNMIGYNTTPENVRNKMKYLRTKYKKNLVYNAKHVQKRIMPYQDELEELYSMDGFDDDVVPTKQLNGSVSSSSAYSPGSQRPLKKAKTIPASHVDLRTVVTSKKKSVSQVKNTKVAYKKKINGKRSAQPLFQCGLCMMKFRTSFDMHGHPCKAVGKTVNHSSPKKKENSPNTFHWNSLITMQFLDLLKEYQESHKNSNFRKGPIWGNMSALMKRLGHKVLPSELEKKWNILSSAFNKTMMYNKTHKDKKKCAFFKRLMDLYEHPASFQCFKNEEPLKMTVEVSPFSFSDGKGQTARSSTSSAISQKKSFEDKKIKVDNNKSELMSWLDKTWCEWKELEKKREALQARRHNELMEMLSYLIDSNHSKA